jgi:hypothetical protein
MTVLSARKIILLLSIAIFWGKANAGEFAVSPMMIELDLLPGESQEFEFKIHGKKKGKANIYFNDMKQQASGHMNFINPITREEDISRWISLSENSISVEEGETKLIRGKVKLPPRISGNRYIAVMVEDAEANANTGVSLNVRYAVILNIQTPVKKKRIQAEINNFDLEKQGDEYFLTGWIENKSNRDAYLDSVVHLRDENRRLAGKVTLKSKSAWQRQENTSRVFPDSRVKVFAPLPGKITNGKYTLVAKNVFGGRAFPSFQKDIVVNNVKSLGPSEKSYKVQISPNPVTLKAVRSGSSFVTLKLTNPVDQEVTVKLPKQGTYDGVDVRFIPQVFTIKPNSSRLVTLKQEFNGKPFKQIFKAELIQGDEFKEYLEIKTEI